MLKVGLTGGIGSGKSSVAQFFGALGVPVIDADAVARRFTAQNSPLLPQIAAHFGGDILLADGQLNRQKLRQLIFHSPGEKTWLEQLLHPPIRAAIINLLECAEGPYVILESPLLFETEQDQLVQKTIVVDITEALQAQRASLRDHCSEADIQAIIAQQMPRQGRLKRADFVIDNSTNLHNTRQQVAALHEQLLLLA